LCIDVVVVVCCCLYGSTKYILYDSDLILQQAFSLVFHLVAITVVSQYDGCLFHEFFFTKYVYILYAHVRLQITQAVQFLHDLGSVQHFQNEFLKSHIVINPQWIVNAMSCMVSVQNTPIVVSVDVL